MAKHLTLHPFLKPFSRLAIANIISNLMVPLAGIIDTAFLGHLADIRYLAGVAIANVIFNVVYWSFGFLRMGTTGLIAQAHGRRDANAMVLVLLRNGLLALGLGLLLLGLQVPIRQLGFWLLSATADVRVAGEAFYNARIWGAPAVLLNYVLLGRFLACGQGKRVILLSLISNGGNILLDYWFIRHLGWASAGAGAATAMSQGLMLLAGLGLVLREHPLQTLWQMRSALWEHTSLRTIFRLNRDILIRTFALVISFALFTNWSSTFGTGILAANTLLLQVVTLAAYFIDGIAFATESFAGRFYGVGDRAQLRVLLKYGMGLSLLLGLGFALIFALWPATLFQLMTQHESVLVEVETYVWWLVPTLGCAAIAYLLDGYFLGLTAGKALRTSTLAATLFGFLPMGLLAYATKTPHLLWLAMTGFMAIRAATLGWMLPKTLRTLPMPSRSVLHSGTAD
ncbi:MAG: MATE family efflux transporter [Leptolyngbya sp. SIO1E4]|nr:MATE family efflux transporter [Leptolyngbya sp. SIO1E4]